MIKNSTIIDFINIYETLISFICIKEKVFI